MGFWSALASGFAGFLGGGAKSAPNPAFAQNSGLGGDAVPAPAPQRSFMDDVKSDAQGVLRNAVFGQINGRLNGRAQRAFNHSAFPGTTNWEQLEAGSTHAGNDFPSGMNKNVEVMQRERESQRSSQTSLQSQRMSSATQLATALISSGGSANSPLIAELIRAGGILPPEHGLRTERMARGVVEAQIGNLDAQARRSDQMLPYDQSLSSQKSLESKTVQDRNRIEAQIRPLEFALEEWRSKYGSSYSAKEVLGWLSIVREASGGSSGLPLSQVLVDAMSRSGVPEGDLYMMRRLLKME